MTRRVRVLIAVLAAALLLFLVPSTALAAQSSRFLGRKPLPRAASPSMLMAKATLSGQAITPSTLLPPSPVTLPLDVPDPRDGTQNIDGTTYRVYLQAGQKLLVTMASGDFQGFGAALYAPSATSLQDDPLAWNETDPDLPAPSTSFSYSVPKSGTYYLDAYAWNGSGTCTLEYSVVTAGADDVFPGVPLPASPVVGTLDDAADPFDIYRVHLDGGQRITATLSGPYDSFFAIAIFGEDAVDPVTDFPLRMGYSEEYPQKLVYTAPTGGGTYFLSVASFGGSGQYNIQYTIQSGYTKSNIAGVALPVSPATGSLDPEVEYDHVYRVHLNAGETFRASLSGASGTAFEAYLYGPNAKDVCETPPIAKSPQPEDAPPSYPRVLTYTAPAAADYYLETFARGDSAPGKYSLTWMKGSGAFTNPIAYDLKSLLTTRMRIRSSQPGVTAKLVLKTASGDMTVFNGTVPNAANTDYLLPAWNGLRSGQRLPSASYDWTLTLTKSGQSVTVKGKLLISKITFAITGTSKANVAVRKAAYMVPGSVNCYINATTASGRADSLNVSLSGPNGYFAKPRTAAGVAPPWTFGPAPLNMTAYIRGTSALRARALHTWSVTGKTNVTYRITVIQ